MHIRSCKCHEAKGRRCKSMGPSAAGALLHEASNRLDIFSFAHHEHEDLWLQQLAKTKVLVSIS